MPNNNPHGHNQYTKRDQTSKPAQPGQGRANNPGNFANDREKAREAGRKGGEAHGTHRQ